MIVMSVGNLERVSTQDLDVLTKFVLQEHGAAAISHVSLYIDRLRESGDEMGARLWAMVLANLSKLDSTRHNAISH